MREDGVSQVKPEEAANMQANSEHGGEWQESLLARAVSLWCDVRAATVLPAATTSGNYPGETRRSPLRRPIRDATRSIPGWRVRASPRAMLQSHRLLSKVQSVDQRMRLECGVGFRQLRTCRRTRPGQLCAKSRTASTSERLIS